MKLKLNSKLKIEINNPKQKTKTKIQNKFNEFKKSMIKFVRFSKNSFEIFVTNKKKERKKLKFESWATHFRFLNHRFFFDCFYLFIKIFKILIIEQIKCFRNWRQCETRKQQININAIVDHLHDRHVGVRHSNNFRRSWIALQNIVELSEKLGATNVSWNHKQSVNIGAATVNAKSKRAESKDFRSSLNFFF